MKLKSLSFLATDDIIVEITEGTDENDARDEIFDMGSNNTSFIKKICQRKNRKKIIITCGVIIIFAVIAFILYFILFNNNTTTK